MSCYRAALHQLTRLRLRRQRHRPVVLTDAPPRVACLARRVWMDLPWFELLWRVPRVSSEYHPLRDRCIAVLPLTSSCSRCQHRRGQPCCLASVRRASTSFARCLHSCLTNESLPRPHCAILTSRMFATLTICRHPCLEVARH